MLTYILLYFKVFIFSILDLIKISRNLKEYLFLFLIVILTLFAGLRYNIGADYLGYYSYFESARIFGDLEIGFEVIVVLVRDVFGGSYEFFVFLFVTLTLIFIYLSIKNHSKIYFIPLYVYMAQYMLGGPMGQMRQALAIAILLYSIKFILDKNFKKFLLLVLIAFSIHASSIIFIIAYAVNYIRLDKSFSIILIILSIIIGNTPLPREILVQLSSLLNIGLLDSVSSYMHSDFGNEYAGPLLAYIERLLVFIVSLWFYSTSDNRSIKVFIQIYWFSLIIFFVFSDISILAQRLSRPFKVVEIFLYGYLVQKFTPNKYLRVIGWLILVVLMFKPIYMIISKPNYYIPYMHIFGN